MSERSCLCVSNLVSIDVAGVIDIGSWPACHEVAGIDEVVVFDIDRRPPGLDLAGVDPVE